MIDPLLTGRVQAGKGDASRWLAKFNEAYSRKVSMPVFPGSLNVALDVSFDWFAPPIVRRTVAFDRTEYDGERDILLVPCLLVNLANEPAWLWTTTTAARDRPELQLRAFRRGPRGAVGDADGPRHARARR